MPSREQELQKYLDKRARKKSKEKQAPPRTDKKVYASSASGTSAATFLIYFKLVSGAQKLGLGAFIALCAGVGAGAVTTPPVGIGVFAGVFVLFVASVFLGYETYARFATGKMYPLIGWDRFITSRSDAFWSGSSFAKVFISVEQTPGASDLERRAVLAFLQNWVDGWNRNYARDWPKAKPRDFFLGHAGVEGHIEIRKGIPYVLKQCTVKFPELVKMLPKDQVKLVFGFGADLDASADVKDREDDYRDFQEENRRYEARERSLDD